MEPVGCHELEYSLSLVNYALDCLEHQEPQLIQPELLTASH